jgi:hypothetical protein
MKEGESGGRREGRSLSQEQETERKIIGLDEMKLIKPSADEIYW